METENYRPANIEFNVAHDGTLMPENFGEFESAEAAAKFIGAKLISINQGITVARHMDSFEKKEIRAEYNDIMENELPSLEKKLSIATSELSEAKKKASDATSTYDAAIIQSKALAAVVKRGLKDMNLDENFTYRIAYKSRYYFYTYMDKQLKLCKISDIPEREKQELFNQMAENEASIEEQFAGEQNNDEAAE